MFMFLLNLSFYVFQLNNTIKSDVMICMNILQYSKLHCKDEIIIYMNIMQYS